MKYCLLFLLLFANLSIYSVVQETASLKEFLYGSTTDCEYDNWVSHISERIVSEDYNLYAPYDRQLNGFGEFNVASDSELEIWNTAIEYFLEGNYTSADWHLYSNSFPFQVVEFTDTDTDRTYYMIRETLNMDYYDNNGTAEPEDDETGGFDFGWGLFIYNPDASNPIVLNVVHPCDDYPATPVALECFQQWDAMFLLIPGAGREVVWTEQGNYTNSKSLSDPSRNTDHAYTQAYHRFCDKIREVFGRREFSAQIHSYDWNRHAGYANCQISAGFYEGCPNLPIRDMSDLKLDMINASDHIIHDMGEIGENNYVYLNDFYGVHYNEYEFIYTNSDTSYTVNNDIDLPGYSLNRQMLYSFDGWNSYDVFEPFLHMELDELPNCYGQITSNLAWFYGYDTDAGLYNMDQIFDNIVLYYQPVVSAMAEILPALFIFDDEATPDTPANVMSTYSGYNEIQISWDPVSSYDFETYEIHYNTDHVTETDFIDFNRDDEDIMASPDQTFITIDDLTENQQYYFIIRAKDYNGNYSDFSPEIYSVTAPAEFDDLTVFGGDSKAILTWNLSEQDGVLGYRIYRKIPESQYILLDDYHNNLELLGGNELGIIYEYCDNTAENEGFYTYMVSSINYGAYEYFYDAEVDCSPREIFFLEIYDSEDILLDSVAFSSNPYASEDYDELYDVIKPLSSYNGILYSAFYEPNWNEEGIYLSREIMDIYDPSSTYETWNLKIKTHLTDQPLTLKVSDNYNRNVEKLYLYSYNTGDITNIADYDFEFSLADTNFASYTLIWGDLLPTVYFTYQSNRIYQETEEVLIDWNINYPVLVDHVDLFISNLEDSLLIASGIESSQTSYDWVVPADFTMHNARYGLDVYTVHDEYMLRNSPFYMGFVPLELSLSPTSGWQMITNPWVDDPITISEAFINRTELYEMDYEFNYSLTDTMTFGTGYWMKILTPNEFTNSSLIEKFTYYRGLAPGWNLVANPHVCSYEIENLKFQIDGNDFTFNQAVRDEFVSRAIYSYRTDYTGGEWTGEYELIYAIGPMETFWIYSYAEELLDISCKFVPYYNSYYSYPETDIQVRVDVFQDTGDYDEMILGLSSETTDDFDYDYDLPEPPEKPLSEAISAYLIKDTEADSTFPYERLNWEYRDELSNSEIDFTTWEFIFEIDTVGPVYFRTEFEEVLPTYTIIMNIDDFQHELIDNDIVTYFAESVGTHQGSITISNGLAYSLRNGIQEFTNHPNPFNPETNIRFDLLEDSAVSIEIYNIRGQKIYTVCDEFLLRGKHSYVWRGNNSKNEKVSSGVYFIRYKTGKTEKTSKLLLLK